MRRAAYDLTLSGHHLELEDVVGLRAQPAGSRAHSPDRQRAPDRRAEVVGEDRKRAAYAECRLRDVAPPGTGLHHDGVGCELENAIEAAHIEHQPVARLGLPVGAVAGAAYG